jgi:hypothetical protein
VFDFAAQEPLYKALHEMAQQNPQSMPSAQQAQTAPAAVSTAKAPVEAKIIATNKDKPAVKKPAARKAKTAKAG